MSIYSDYMVWKCSKASLCITWRLLYSHILFLQSHAFLLIFVEYVFIWTKAGNARVDKVQLVGRRRNLITCFVGGVQLYRNSFHGYESWDFDDSYLRGCDELTMTTWSLESSFRILAFNTNLEPSIGLPYIFEYQNNIFHLLLWDNSTGTTTQKSPSPRLHACPTIFFNPTEKRILLAARSSTHVHPYTIDFQNSRVLPR